MLLYNLLIPSFFVYDMRKFIRIKKHNTNIGDFLIFYNMENENSKNMVVDQFSDIKKC